MYNQTSFFSSNLLNAWSINAVYKFNISTQRVLKTDVNGTIQLQTKLPSVQNYIPQTNEFSDLLIIVQSDACSTNTKQGIMY